MTWLVPQLKHRIQIQKGGQAPLENGVLGLTYETLKTVWAEVKHMSLTSAYMMAVRGVSQTEDIATHVIRIRSSAIYGLGQEFSVAFDSSFDEVADLNMIKSNYFLFLNSGSSAKGRRFRIKGMQLDEASGEYIRIFAQELGEEGTGWPK